MPLRRKSVLFNWRCVLLHNWRHSGYQGWWFLVSYFWSYHIHVHEWHVVTEPCLNFNGSFVKQFWFKWLHPTLNKRCNCLWMSTSHLNVFRDPVPFGYRHPLQAMWQFSWTYLWKDWESMTVGRRSLSMVCVRQTAVAIHFFYFGVDGIFKIQAEKKKHGLWFGNDQYLFIWSKPPLACLQRLDLNIGMSIWPPW